MAEYYLISQLPGLDALGDNTPVPITEERFTELCERFLSKKAFDEVKAITLLPPKDPPTTKSALVDAWYRAERDLRLALAKARAEKLNKPLDTEVRQISAELSRMAETAIDIENPLEAEKYLLTCRLSLLEALRPTDTFSEEYIFYYAIRLKLILRIRQFDTKLGEDAYKNIYNSILIGDTLEAKQ